MDIKIEVRAPDDIAFDQVDLASGVPENVSMAMEGPFVERSADVNTALFAFLISIAAGVPSDLIAQWIANLITSQFASKADTITITIDNKVLTLKGDLLKDTQTVRIIADELEIQIRKSG